MIKQEQFSQPEKKYSPDVRWWLAEGFHTDQTLKNDIRLLDESGFGAAEFLAMEEPGADSKIYGWGSEEWVHDSGLIFDETTKRGMGVSATCGTNWSNANLTTITPDDPAAAKELDYVTERLSAGQSRSGEIPKCMLKMPGVTKQDLVAVVAAKDLGEKDGLHYLAKDTIVLTDETKEGVLSFTAPDDGDYLLFYFWIHGTGQTAAPSVSTSYTVNYLDHDGIDAFKKYWDAEVLTPELKETIEKNGRAMMYMDSLELSTFSAGGQLWGYHFLEEFKNRRGYDLTSYLPFIVKNCGAMDQVDFVYHYHMEDTLFAEKLYNDLYQTMTDLYMNNMMKPMKEWCNKNHLQLRSEISYGLPFEISQPGKYVDGVETESLEFCSQIESHRGLAGTAHIYNHIFSCETGATTMNYMMPMEFYNQMIFTQFASGVSRTVLHGYSSIAGSEDSTYWPGHEGMWPIFSERFGCRQPAFQHYNDWTGMLARYQLILRQGKPRMDLGILRIDYNYNNQLSFSDTEIDQYTKNLMRGHEGIYWKDMSLQDHGYTWDYFAPQILEEDFVTCKDGVLLPDGPGYQALIIYQEMLPLTSAKKILSLAEEGLPVLFVNGVTETIRPGITKTHKKAASLTPFNHESDQELTDIVGKIKALPNVKEIDAQSESYQALQNLKVYPRASFATPNQNILPLLRQDENTVYAYFYNYMYQQTDPCSFTVAIRGTGKPYRLDCWNGTIEEVASYRVGGDTTILDLSLAPGDACLYAVDLNASEEKHAVSSVNCSLVKNADGLCANVFSEGHSSVSFSDGSVKEFTADSVPEDLPLPKWDLIVEDWNEGPKQTIVEDRGKGIVTKEVYYETLKPTIDAGTVDLKPWCELPAIGPDVSGVGYYSTSFALPENFDDNCGAVLCIESTNGGTGAVYVNGQKTGGFDLDDRTVDITPWLKAGENKITVEVTTTLNNRLMANGYYDQVTELSTQLSNSANNMFDSSEVEDEGGVPGMSFEVNPQMEDYGMTGEVKLKTYRSIKL